MDFFWAGVAILYTGTLDNHSHNRSPQRQRLIIFGVPFDFLTIEIHRMRIRFEVRHRLAKPGPQEAEGL